jgi:phosphopantetheinyl transferase (holo-ACP synthase)
MVVGTGIDIVNIDRIERLMGRWGDPFLGHIRGISGNDGCRTRNQPYPKSDPRASKNGANTIL